MWSDLGRLDAVAEILQVGPSLGAIETSISRGQTGSDAGLRARLAPQSLRWYKEALSAGNIAMKVFRVAAAIAVLAWPAYARAQMPNINLIPETASKTQEERDADEVREKAYRDSLRKIPDAKVSSDPWGTVRSGDAPKAPAKPRTKTGSTAN